MFNSLIKIFKHPFMISTQRDSWPNPPGQKGQTRGCYRCHNSCGDIPNSVTCVQRRWCLGNV